MTSPVGSLFTSLHTTMGQSNEFSDFIDEKQRERVLRDPGYYSLADARQWHLAVAWPFALLLAFAWAAILINGHFRRDLMTRRREWRWAAIRSDLAAHLRLDFTHEAAKFNFLQKLTYGLVLGVILPGMVVTGMGISPGLSPAMAPLIDLVGGRQSI